MPKIVFAGGLVLTAMVGIGGATFDGIPNWFIALPFLCFAASAVGKYVDF